MKKLILSFVLVNMNINLYSFEVSGFNLGDNLLDKLSFSYIIKNKHQLYSHLNDPDKYTNIIINDHPEINLDNDQVAVVYKKIKNEFSIISISSINFYENNINKCYEDLSLYLDYFESQYPETKFISNVNQIHEADPYGESTYSSHYIQLNDNFLSLQCYDWSEKMTTINGWTDSLNVSSSTIEFQMWIADY